MNKKGQIQQLFIYIMAIIVIGFLVLFGYRMIDKLFNQKCDVEQQSFYTQLGQDLGRSTRYDSISEGKLTKPCNYEQICFVDKKFFINNKNGLPISYKTTHPLIWANTNDSIKVKYNIYLRKGGINGQIVPILYDDHITTADPNIITDTTPLICINASMGTFNFLIRGLGKNGIYIYDGT